MLFLITKNCPDCLLILHANASANSKAKVTVAGCFSFLRGRVKCRNIALTMLTVSPIDLEDFSQYFASAGMIQEIIHVVVYLNQNMGF
jgi:hypothetical protein